MYPILDFALPGWPQDAVRELSEFAERHRDELDRCGSEGRFSSELFRLMGERGWVGPIVAKEEGGLGGGVAEYCLVCEEVARRGLISPQISVQGERWLQDWGTEEQRGRYLGEIARGQMIFSEAISEPGGSSSLRELRTTARRDGHDWLLNGTKHHVNMGHQSDVTLVFASSDVGLTSFLVDRHEHGFESRETAPIGVRTLPTAEIHLRDVRVPNSAILGEPGAGMKTFLSTFNISRLGNASELIGIARRSLAGAIQYAKRRDVGGERVASFQGIQWTIANSYSRLHAAALARDYAAKVAAGDGDPALPTTLAKKLAIDAGEDAVNEAYALIGSHGLYYDTPYAQLLHDLKVYRVAGGSLEVMRNFIAKRVLRDHGLGGLE